MWDQLPANVRPASFAGRLDELSRLSNALRDSRVVILEGESGVGKSRLVREFLASDSRPKGPILVGACAPYKTPLPLGVVVSMVRSTQVVARADMFGPLSGPLGALFPEWTNVLPSDDTPYPEDVGTARYRLFVALGELLDTLRVSVLVFDDAHWAEDATVDFMLFLARRAGADTRLLLISRPEDAAASDAAIATLDALAADVRRVELGPLSVVEVGQVVSSMLDGGPVSNEFSAYLHARTGGLPLAVEESVRLLADKRDLVRRPSGWMRRNIDELAVPSSVRGAVLARMRTLHPDAVTALRGVAVFGAPVEIDDLVRLCGSGAAIGVGEAAASGLLRDCEDGVEFCHVLAQQAVEASIPAVETRRLHARAAAILATSSPLPAERLIRHYRLAKDVPRWHAFVEQAAQNSIEAGDNARAMVYLDELLQAMPGSASDRARLGRLLAFAMLHRTQLCTEGLLRRVVDTLTALACSSALSEEERAAIANPLGRVRCQLGEFDEGFALLESAVPGLSTDPFEQAMAMVTIALPRGSHISASASRSWLAQAARVPTTSFSEGQYLRLLIARAIGAILIGEQSGWTLAESVPAVAADQSLREVLAGAHANLAYGAMLWGRYEAARRSLDRSVALHGDDESRADLSRMATTAHLDLHEGQWAGLVERTEMIMRDDTVDVMDRTEAMLVRGLLLSNTEGSDAGIDLLEAVSSTATRLGVPDLLAESRAALAAICLRDGRVDDALAFTSDVMQIIVRSEVWVWTTDIAPIHVEALTLAGRRDEARAVTDRIGAAAQRSPGLPALRAAATTCAAIVAEAGNEWSSAVESYHDATQIWDSLPRPLAAAHQLEREARCALEAGDARTGTDLLAIAADRLMSIGARVAFERVSRDAARHNSTAARRPSRGYGDQLSPREVEVVTLVADGLQNRQIAARLTLSHKTVARHVDSAMRKLQVTSRTGLAVAALTRGIVVADDKNGSSAH